MRWVCFSDDDIQLQEARKGYRTFTADAEKQITDRRSFLKVLGARSRCLPAGKMLLRDSYPDFEERKVIADAAALVTHPAALMHRNSDSTVVCPSPQGDIELLYDLGRQDCGYFEIDLVADAGVVVDLHAVEHIEGDRIQHTHYNRNTMRYVTKQGANTYVSQKRRAGRFLFVTIRNATGPVSICRIGLISSTYPVEHIGAFSCSDSRLAEVWHVCARTLQLCMEDTFTDCPLYEQTLWVGDARNEALFAYPIFGATDLARRCLGLAAQSLERLPLVGCQAPSDWDCIIPAWSFLWGVGVWDYYWYSGDKGFLAEIWPAVSQNLRKAEAYVDQRGLFSEPFWNMFDWARIDDERECVIHNSLFMVGAIDAARKCAAVLNRKTQDQWLSGLRRRLVEGINACWDDDREAYPDSIHQDGTVSTSTCQHTSFLALLYDVIPASKRKIALQNVLEPPSSMVKVGSPFAMLYLYEALEKCGHEDDIIASIHRKYLPMLKAGATTVWECFPGGTATSGEFATRSHCHGWSAAAAYFLTRIVLGVKQTDVGGKAFDISPRLSGLDWARGRVATMHGPLGLSWEVRGRTLVVDCTLPPGVNARFVRNSTHKGLRTHLDMR